MVPDRRLKLGEAWRPLAPGQGMRVVAASFVALAMAAVLGAVVIGSREQRNLGRKGDHVAALVAGLTSSKSELAREFADLSVGHSELLERYVALERSLAASRADRQALAGEAEFLNRYMAYLGAGGVAKVADPKPLIDALCALRQSSDKQFTRFESGPLEITSQDFEQGRMPSDLQTLLAENFVSLDSLREIRVADAAQAALAAKAGKPGAHLPAPSNVSASPLMASVSRQAQSIKLVKSVRFLDGPRYEIPRSIAVGLQIRRECAPH